MQCFQIIIDELLKKKTKIIEEFMGFEPHDFNNQDSRGNQLNSKSSKSPTFHCMYCERQSHNSCLVINLFVGHNNVEISNACSVQLPID